MNVEGSSPFARSKAQVGIDEARIPYHDQADRSQVQRIDPLRAAGRRRAVYHQSLNAYGREPFKPNDAGRWPTTIMATDDVLGEVSCVFRVPKVRNSDAHKCAKPVELMVKVGPSLAAGDTRRDAELLLSGGRMSLGDQFSDRKGLPRAQLGSDVGLGALHCDPNAALLRDRLHWACATQLCVP